MSQVVLDTIENFRLSQSKHKAHTRDSRQLERNSFIKTYDTNFDEKYRLLPTGGYEADEPL